MDKFVDGSSRQIDWHFGRKPIAQIDEAIALYKSTEFCSPSRSTVALLSLIKNGGPLWSNIISELASSDHRLDGHLEFRVSPPRGQGLPSHTDLMLIGSTEAIAIEAKWTEPRYEQVSKWNSSNNRQKVLEGWISLIQGQTSKALHVDDFRNVVYQTVHRAASVCSITNREPTMVYIQFSLREQQTTNFTYIDDLRHLYKILGSPSGFSMKLIDVRMDPTDSFKKIAHLPKGPSATADVVMSSLRGESLFRFTDLDIIEFNS